MNTRVTINPNDEVTPVEFDRIVYSNEKSYKFRVKNYKLKANTTYDKLERDDFFIAPGELDEYTPVYRKLSEDLAVYSYCVLSLRETYEAV